jgi:hypothetical protein
VTLSFCEVHSSLTGHNVKSRAYFNRVEYCHVHDSANREFDLVDADDTAAPGSHAVLIGNIIVKDKACQGNRAVIHFGQDGGKEHDGTLYLVHNTIVTPFVSPVVDLSARGAGARLAGNIVWDAGSGQRNQQLVSARGGADVKGVLAACNWLSAGFAGAGVDTAKNCVSRGEAPPFAGPEKGDYRLAKPAKGIVNAGMPLNDIALPPVPGAPKNEATPPLSWQYVPPADKQKRAQDGRPDLGAYELVGK